MQPEWCSSLFKPGRNCWRMAHADRVAFLIDADAYFHALREAIIRAERSVFIVGWDIDSRLRLLREGEDDGFPGPLAQFLDTVVRRRKELRIYILTWDFAMIYAAEREWLPIYRLDWETHRRIYFYMDGAHPPGASHHQKLAVIDDRLAFVGGLDLTKRRWDTPEHAPDEAARIDPDDAHYSPFHDVQMMVSGEAAAALGELARQRWWRATGYAPRVGAPLPAHPPWPPWVAADVEDIAVAIARTEPQYENQPAIQEVKQLYLDAIAIAEKTIYLENQYLTAHAVGEALAARLREPGGPEVVVVSTLHTTGWLSRITMDVLRARLLRRLRQADRYGRFRAYYPYIPGLDDEDALKLHSKVMVIDERIARVGSANLNNRSMGLDTECDLALDACGDAAQSAAVARFRNRLLAEHLGVAGEAFAQRLARHGSLIGAIESLMNDGRSLRELSDKQPEEAETAPVLDTALLDPEWPISADVVVAHLLPADEARPLRQRMAALALTLAALAGLAVAWRWTPLGDWLNPAYVIASIGRIGEVLGPVAAVGGFALASIAAVPLTFLVLVAIVAFGPLAGFAYSLAGATLGAAASYGLGHAMGRDVVRRLAGRRINRLSRRLASRGILAVTVLRLLPIAPFAIVNMIAGASHIRLRDFLVGTALGLTPGILALTVFVDRIVAALRDPGPGTVLILALAVVLIGSGAWWLRRWLRRPGDE
ncbi:MAG: VTT domain-containing protein [Sulfuricella sp.]|nr:VTT domain-containing protein [Sulfuricella sp.]